MLGEQTIRKKPYLTAMGEDGFNDFIDSIVYHVWRSGIIRRQEGETALVNSGGIVKIFFYQQ